MMADRHIRNVALIGFMGSGKTTVGHLLARNLGFEFVDTDHLIEVRAGMSISDLFAQRGEAAFRELEKTVVDELATRQRTVIATGGGVGANAELLGSLKHHALVVWLWVSPETVWQRVRHQTHRPLLHVPDPQARIRELLVERASVYREADVLVNASARGSVEVAHQVAHHFRTAQRDPSAA